MKECVKSVSMKRRTDAQSAFSTGASNIVVATDAFGLGVDYPDVRAVVLFDPANDVSAFVQQAGRAGRDGRTATVYLCSGDADEGWESREFLVRRSFPELDQIRDVWQFLKSGDVALHAGRVCKGLGVRFDLVEACVHWLVQKKLILPEPDPSDRRRRLYRATGDFGDIDWDDLRADKAEALDAFRELRDLWRLPAAQIPNAIISAFSDTREGMQP
jgi:hypothetical protein